MSAKTKKYRYIMPLWETHRYVWRGAHTVEYGSDRLMKVPEGLYKNFINNHGQKNFDVNYKEISKEDYDLMMLSK
jgi:hypothetical protein